VNSGNRIWTEIMSTIKIGLLDLISLMQYSEVEPMKEGC
jgi:hypothetical protein